MQCCEAEIQQRRDDRPRLPGHVRSIMVENIAGIDPYVIEAQLAHGKSGPPGSAYDRAEHMTKRKSVMLTWADYLDQRRIGAKVIDFRAA